MYRFAGFHRNALVGLIALLAAFAVPQVAPGGSALMEALEKRERELKGPEKDQPYYPKISTPTVQIEYTAEQIAAILKRADDSWDQYLALRPQLRKDDLREQAYARRAAALRYRVKAVKDLLEKERKKPTREGPVTVPEALTWLDHATELVDYDRERVLLRMEQERILPPGQPFCICGAPAYARVSPRTPGNFVPITRATLAVARGEAESFQMIVIPFWQSLKGVSFEVEPFFRMGSVDQLPPGQVRLWLVESIKHRPAAGRIQYWPDPLRPTAPVDVPATTSLSVLVDARAGLDQPPGPYVGAIVVSAEQAKPMRIDVRVIVRDFSIEKAMPAVACWVQNEELRSAFGTDQPRELAAAGERFLRDYGMRLYRPGSAGENAEGWISWLPLRNTLMADAAPTDPYAPAHESALPWRQAGWGAWRAAPALGQTGRWLVRDWIGARPGWTASAERLENPLVHTAWSFEDAGRPPGLVYLNQDSLPEPTLRLISLRDGIEDFAYQYLFATRLHEAESEKAIGWLKKRKYRKLLSPDKDLGDPSLPDVAVESKLLEHRERIAEAIEALDRALKKKRGK